MKKYKLKKEVKTILFYIFILIIFILMLKSFIKNQEDAYNTCINNGGVSCSDLYK